MSKTHMIDERKTHHRHETAYAVCGLSGLRWWRVTESEHRVTCKNCLRMMENKEKRHAQSTSN